MNERQVRVKDLKVGDLIKSHVPGCPDMKVTAAPQFREYGAYNSSLMDFETDEFGTHVGYEANDMLTVLGD